MATLKKAIKKLRLTGRRPNYQFFKSHIVHGVTLILTVVGLVISWAVPAVSTHILVWLLTCWACGEAFYFLRESRRPLPEQFRWVLDPEVIWLYGLGGVVAAGILMWIVLHNPDYQRAMRADILWAFFMIPLVFASRWGRPTHLGPLLGLSLVLVVSITLLTMGFSANALASGAASGLLLAMISLGADAALRTVKEKDMRVQRLSGIIERVSNRQIIKPHYGGIAQIISEGLDYPIVHIMIWDPEQRALLIRAACGVHRKHWKQVRILPNQGLTGCAFASGHPRLCNDVLGREGQKLGYVQPLGYEGIHSELAVPLVYRKERLGILDFQSMRAGDFDDDDVAEAQLLASAVAIAIKWNQMALTQLLLWKTLTHAQRSLDIDTLIDEILEMAQRDLGASVILFYPIIPETGLPRRPSPYYKGRLLSTVPTDQDRNPFLPKDLLFDLVRAWRVHFSSNAMGDQVVRGKPPQKDDFVSREGIQSVFALPLGRPDYKLGMMLVYFRDYREFSSAIKAQTQAFGAVFTLAIWRLLERSRTTKDIRAGLHRNLARYLYRVRTQLAALRSEADGLRTRTLDVKLRQLEEATEQMHSHVLRDTVGIFGQRPTTLRDAILNACGSLIVDRSVEPRVNVMEGVEQLHPWLHEILYTMTVEALGNAISHGRATSVSVDIRLNGASGTTGSVDCTILDDGCGFDPGSVRRSDDGIFAIKDWIEQELDGSVRFLPREERGMRVEASIPIMRA